MADLKSVSLTIISIQGLLLETHGSESVSMGLVISPLLGFEE